MVDSDVVASRAGGRRRAIAGRDGTGPDELADRVADRVVARLAGLFTRGQDAEADGEPEATS